MHQREIHGPLVEKTDNLIDIRDGKAARRTNNWLIRLRDPSKSGQSWLDGEPILITSIPIFSICPTDSSSKGVVIVSSPWCLDSLIKFVKSSSPSFVFKNRGM